MYKTYAATAHFGYLDIKRYVGVEHDDVTIAHRLDGYSCRNAKSPKCTVGFEISFEEVDMVADCQELVGYVLARVKTTVEEKLGFHVESCEVSVSSTFHQTQRLALLAACKDVGFVNVRFLSDCLCARIAFDVLFKKLLHPRNVLIFDFGSYKCESSVVTVGGKIYQVKSMSGLDSVGGVDVDNLIAKRFEQNFLQQNKKKKLLKA